MASKLPRLVRELAMWLLIGVAVSLAVDYFRQPALPHNAVHLSGAAFLLTG